MVAILLLFLVLALVFGIGGAIQISLWFLLLLVAAVVLGILALKALTND